MREGALLQQQHVTKPLSKSRAIYLSTYVANTSNPRANIPSQPQQQQLGIFYNGAGNVFFQIREFNAAGLYSTHSLATINIARCRPTLLPRPRDALQMRSRDHRPLYRTIICLGRPRKCWIYLYSRHPCNDNGDVGSCSPRSS